MTKYRIKIGDTTTITYGFDKRDAWEGLIVKIPHYIYCSKPDDLEKEINTGLEEYLAKHEPEFGNG